MNKRLIVHAGVHRTGTSALQQTFSANASLLAQHGILYPHYDSAPDSSHWSHVSLAWDIHRGRINFAKLRAWAESLTASPAHTVVLSAEDFCILRNLQFLDCFSDLFDMEAVFYLRRQDCWIDSWYNQHKKWPFDSRLARASPLEFLNHLDEFYWIRYFDTLDRWAKKLGRDRIRARVLEEGQIENAVADMCDLCGIDFVLERQVERTNESLPSDHIEILRRLDTNSYSNDVKTVINRALSRVPSTCSPLVFPKSIRQLILGRYSIQNQKAAEHYLGRSDRVLFKDTSFPDAPESIDPPVSAEQLLALIRNIIDEFTSASAHRNRRSDPQQPPTESKQQSTDSQQPSTAAEQQSTDSPSSSQPEHTWETSNTPT